MLEGQDTDGGEEVGRVVLVSIVAVAFEKGAGVAVEKAEERIAVLGRDTMELLNAVVELVVMDETFNGADMLREAGAVVTGTGTLVVVFKGNEILLGEGLTAVALGKATLDKFEEAEGIAAEGDEVAVAEVELDTAGGLGGAGIYRRALGFVNR